MNKASNKKIYKLAVFVPASHLQSVKQALFEAGAGRYQNYDCCSWESLGTGQFRPLQGSQPFLGNQNQLEKVSEYKVEMIVQEEFLTKALSALKAAHPYEEPAFEVYDIKQFSL